MHDPRGKTGVALSYALSPTGADHMETPHDGSFAGEGVNDEKDLKKAIQLYYDMMDWDSEGKPTRGKLYDLNLEWLPEAQ